MQETILKQLGAKYDNLTVSRDSEDLDIEKAMEAKMSEADLYKMCQSAPAKA